MRMWTAVLMVSGLGLVSAAAVAAQAQDADRAVAGGGITAAGWEGVVDAKSAAQGRTLKDSKFEKKGDALHLTIGPAATYWNPANTARGDYTVKGTFTEPKQGYNHPHPMGVFIGGSKLGTPEQTLMYCTAYRNGTFIIRRFNGNAVSQVVPRTENAAIKKAATVINGTSVASLAKADIVGPGKLESTDGIWGIRVSHNMDLVVTNLGVAKN
jgi:opacity protein-like surface antigen